MSEPVTNVEIEDVLSSIRRLVSDEARVPKAVPDDTRRSNAATETLGQSEDMKAAEPALTLTPALRVQDVSAPQDDLIAPAPDTAEMAPNDGDAHAAQDDALAEPVSEPVFEHHASTEENAASVDVVAEDYSSESYWSERQGEDASEDHAETSHADHSAVYGADHSADDHNDDDPQDEVAEAAPLEPLVLDWQDAAGDEMDEAAGTGMDVDAAFDDVEDAEVVADEAETSASQPSEADPDAPPQVGMDEGAPHRTIEDKIAALEALIGKTGDDFEPESPEDTSASITRLPWPKTDEVDVAPITQDVPDPDAASQSSDFDPERIAFAAARAAATQEAEDELTQTAADALQSGLTGDDTTVLDEEMLRDMVADIVRQELQGPLGERITRNVRKLVRREIYRALAANELD